MISESMSKVSYLLIILSLLQFILRKQTNNYYMMKYLVKHW